MNAVTRRGIDDHFFQIQDAVAALEHAWEEQLPSLPKPDSTQFMRWVRIHGYDTEPVLYGIRAAATKLRFLPHAFNDPDHPIAYVSRAANNFRRQRPGAGRAA